MTGTVTAPILACLAAGAALGGLAWLLVRHPFLLIGLVAAVMALLGGAMMVEFDRSPCTFGAAVYGTDPAARCAAP